MVVMSSTQHPTEIRHKVAGAPGAPVHAARVEMWRMGGGFGDKESQGKALVAAASGRAAKMRHDRCDDMIVTGKRHDFRIAHRVGFDSEGWIAGLDVTHWARCGWAVDLSLPVAACAMLHADNACWLPTVRITFHRMRTTTANATALRDFGGPQAMLGQDRIIDHVAHHTARDPDDIRRANDDPNVAGGLSAPRPAAGASPPEDTSGSKTRAGGAIPEHRRGDTAPYGQQVADFVLNDLTTRLRDTSDFARRCSEIAAWNADQPVLKRGLSMSPVKFGISFTLTHLDQAIALVNVHRDGAIAMNHGGTEMVQGLFQNVAQVVAARFGVGADPVRITATDTAKVPKTSATAASSGSDTIYRSKAVGEPPFMLGICAFLALWDAVAACGDGVTASDLDAPAIPERGLAAVQRQRAVAL